MNLKKRLGIYLPVFIIAALATVILRSVAIFKDFNFESGYFDDKLLVTISNLSLLFGVLFLLSYLFVARKPKPVLSFTSPLTYIPAGIVCCALLFVSADFFVKLLEAKPAADTLFTKGNVFPLLIAIFAIVTVANLLLTVLIPKKEDETRAFFGIMAAVFLALFAAYLYFDAKLPLNAPNKMIDEMAFLLAAIFFLHETRISLGREIWRAYIGFGLAASLVLAYSSVPTVIVYFAKGEIISDSLASAILTLSLTIYILLRVILVCLSKEDTMDESVMALSELSKEREEELALPDQARILRKSEEFNTIGENYEFDLKISEAKKDSENQADDEQKEKRADL